MPMNPLLVDSREPKAIQTALKDIATVLEMPEGDYGTFVGKDYYLIERKTVGDFLNSQKSGQLSTQLRATRRRTPYAFFLLEGWFAPTKEAQREGKAGLKYSGGRSKFSYYGILNYLVEIQLYLGIMVIQTSSTYATIQWLRSFYDWCKKSEHTAISRVAMPQVAENMWDPESSDKLRFLMSLPGIGQGTAASILTGFPSLAGFLNATPNQVEAIKGLGVVTRKKIWEFLDRPEPPQIKKRMKPEDKIKILKDLIENPLDIHPNEADSFIRTIMGRPVWCHELANPEMLYDEIKSGKSRQMDRPLCEIAEEIDSELASSKDNELEGEEIEYENELQNREEEM